MPGVKPSKKELAQMKAMSDLGLSPTAIARRMAKSHNTVIKYLESDVYKKPDLAQIVERIKQKELQDLYLLGAKARKNLHTLLDEGKMKAIENIAAMDRVFQQRRLLEGKSTENIFSLTNLIRQSHDKSLGDLRTGENKRGEGAEPIG